MTRSPWLTLSVVLLVAAVPLAAEGRMGGGGGGGGGVMMHSAPRGAPGMGGSWGHGGNWNGGNWHGGNWHGHGGNRVFVGGFFYEPFLFPPYFPLYTAPYPYYWGWGWGPYDAPVEPPPYAAVPYAAVPDAAPPDATQQPPNDDDRYAGRDDLGTYGLVQLRGVPDGAAVDLDHRFWLEARELDERWLALPAGAHTITVRVRGKQPVERDLEVRAGQQHVVKVGPLRSSEG